MPHYIVLIGKRASGKDAFSDYALKKFQIPSIRFSSILAELGIKLGLIRPDELNEKPKLQFIGNTIRQKFGEEYYTKKLAEKIKGKTYIINGSRHPKEINCLRRMLKNPYRFFTPTETAVSVAPKIYDFRLRRKFKEFPHVFENNLITIGIISSDELRFKRTKKQGIIRTKKEFQELESNPAEQNIDLLLKQADYKIENNTTSKDFYKKIDKLFSKLKLNSYK